MNSLNNMVLTYVGKHWRFSWSRWCGGTRPPQPRLPHGCRVQPQSWSRSGQGGERAILRGQPCPSLLRYYCPPLIVECTLGLSAFLFASKQQQKHPDIMFICWWGAFKKQTIEKSVDMSSHSNSTKIFWSNTVILHFTIVHIGERVGHSWVFRPRCALPKMSRRKDLSRPAACKRASAKFEMLILCEIGRGLPDCGESLFSPEVHWQLSGGCLNTRIFRCATIAS